MRAAPNDRLPDPPPTLPKTVVLVGMMGSGKTAVGRKLARKLGVPFRDADAEIESAAGCSIADIFELHGEEAFRAGERRVMARLLNAPAHILAAGGGAFMDKDTRADIARTAISVWLQVSADTLARRLRRRARNRPLLKSDAAASDMEGTIRRLVAERDPIYATADIIVPSDEGTTADTVRRVLAALEPVIRQPESGDAP